MLEMFRVRDRQPVPGLVPWAGEFAGKYLISAVQACRMSDDPRLRPFVAAFVAELIATQADDGYIGPFRHEERLLGNWDLWGHYHVMLGLIMWYEDTGDQAALDCAIRAADLVCNTFLDTGKRVWDAGSHEMNMSVITTLGHLHRLLTGKDPERAARYLRMMRDIEADWQRPPAGDYLRSALEGKDFFRTPKPRWESLHDLQGLVELYRITGDDSYRRAFVQHWTSIRNYDRHPDGGFTTGEQAIGNPYSDGAIETCCTIAWMALTVDMLRLTGDPAAADELELATWNGMLGAQHPSGRWWTYNTPLDGVREASAHTIVFQSRFGTPELNCCSVNAPRGLGMLSEWAALRDDKGVAVSYYGPCEIHLPLADGTHLALRQETAYPAEGAVRLIVQPDAPREFTLRLRIPAWSANTRVTVNGEEVGGVKSGSYLALERTWNPGDVVELSLDMSLRYWAGEMGKTGQAALYRGPVLLAFDQKHNALDTGDVPALDLANLQATPVTCDARFQPIVLLELPAADGQRIHLCDFATAGAHGTHYRAWLPAVNARPAPFSLKHPADGARASAQAVALEWTGYRATNAAGRTFRVEVARDEAFTQLVTRTDDVHDLRLVLRDLAPNVRYWWRVTAVNAVGMTAVNEGAWSFITDPNLQPMPEAATAPEPREDGALLVAPLAGGPEPEYGLLERAEGLTPAPGPGGQPDTALAFNGTSSKLTYALPWFPETSYTASAWVCPTGLPVKKQYEQVFSAWGAGVDDPLRIVLDGTRVFARIEASQFSGTEGLELQNGQWVHVAAVKDGGRLALYVNGEKRAECPAPATVHPSTLNVGVGCNPNFTGNEVLEGSLCQVRLYARALSDDEVAALYESTRP
jgi:hypothetical protein